MFKFISHLFWGFFILLDLFSHAHGENFGMKFAKYFDRPDIEGIAPIYGHYIDPITRTSEHLIIIKEIFTGLF